MTRFPENILKPKRLRPGSTLGIVTPAGRPGGGLLAGGCKLLEELGFKTLLAARTSAGAGWPVESDKARAAQLMHMLTDPDVDAVICSRGGYGSMRVLPFIDWSIIGRLGKPLIGFSDICALLQTMVIRSGLVAFHAPMVCTLAESDSTSLDALRQALVNDRPLRLTAERPIIVATGKADGVLAGGNLTTLCHLVGTPYSVCYEKCILFLEDVGEAPYRIDRMLWQMQQAGCFEGLAGVALGSFKNCGDEEHIFEIVRTCFAQQRIPILAGFEMGHAVRNLSWPLGAVCRLDTESGRIDLIECATR